MVSTVGYFKSSIFHRFDQTFIKEFLEHSYLFLSEIMDFFLHLAILEASQKLVTDQLILGIKNEWLRK